MTDNSNLLHYVGISQKNFPVLIGENITKYGLCTFDSLKTEQELYNFANKIGNIVKHPDADKYGVTIIKPDTSKINKEKAVGGAFTRDELPLHTDGKGISEYKINEAEIKNGPADFFILNVMYVEDPSTAVPIFCDSKLLYENIRKHDSELFNFLISDRAITKYTTQPNYEYSGPLFKIINDKVTVRFNIDESHDWPSGYLEKFLSFTKEISFSMPLKSGQAYLIDNRRMLHGRSPVGEKGNREAWHILIYANKNQEIGKYLPVY